MSEATISLATPEDDAGIRYLLARHGVPGRIALTYRREPDYFLGCGPMGHFNQVLVARQNSEIVGLACRAVRPMFINGTARPFGYLGQLRVSAAHQGRWVVTRGFRYLRQLHEDRRVPAYVTTIVEGNRQADGVLTGRRKGSIPRYRYYDRLHTLALVIPRDSRRQERTDVIHAIEEELPEIVSFLNSHGARRQFFPLLSIEDFGSAITRDLNAGDWLVLRDRDGIAGVCALWDQTGYKQTVVNGYAGMLATMRPLYNLASRCRGHPQLPPPGGVIRTASASFISVRGDDSRLLRALLDGVVTAASARRLDYVVAAFCDRDPLLSTARRLPHVPYRSDVYTVAWEDGQDFHDQLDDRPGYLDPALL